jgi:hypothetical protein
VAHEPAEGAKRHPFLVIVVVFLAAIMVALEMRLGRSLHASLFSCLMLGGLLRLTKGRM